MIPKYAVISPEDYIVRFFADDLEKLEELLDQEASFNEVEHWEIYEFAGKKNQKGNQSLSSIRRYQEIEKS